jgi:hypothetical protein
MPTWKVRGHFYLVIEDAETEQDAKDVAIEQIGDALVHLSFEDALEVKVERVPDGEVIEDIP